MNGAGPADDHALEWMVDVHAFTPGRPRAPRARRRVRRRARPRRGAARELVRLVQPHARGDRASTTEIPWGWFRYAYRGYIVLQKVDARLLEPHLPPAGFYNLMLVARKPG